MKLTLFLGAGFSAPFGHPTMDTFFGFSDTCKRLNEDDRYLLGRLLLEARSANSFLESSPTNLEDILSFSEMGERLRLTKRKEKRTFHLRSIIQKVYTTPGPPRNYWKRYNALKIFLGKNPGDFKGNLSFVTTNYDLNIESACWHLGAQVDPGFKICQTESEDVPTAGSFYQTGEIPLYKLHGSVNWYFSKKGPGIAVEDRVVQLLPLGDEARPTLPQSCRNEYEPPSEPVIIPPSFLKPDLPDALKTVWQGAAKALSTATVVAFVGYSFPPSDTEMMYFLARALYENAGLRAVYIIDKRANDITSRLKGVGSKIGSHFRDLIKEPINSDWRAEENPLHIPHS